MTTKKRPENHLVLTGLAHWCSFITPDSYKGNPDAYKGRLLIEESKAADLMQYLDTANEEQWEKVSEGKKKLAIHPMYRQSEKFEGYIEVAFKQYAEVTLKDGSIWEPIPVIYNQAAQRDPDLEVIPNGATIRVAWSPCPWDNPNMCGVRMRPVSVQIVDMTTQLPGFGESGGSFGGNPFAPVAEDTTVFESKTEESSKEEIEDTEGEVEAINF